MKEQLVSFTNYLVCEYLKKNGEYRAETYLSSPESGPSTGELERWQTVINEETKEVGIIEESIAAL